MLGSANIELKQLLISKGNVNKDTVSWCEAPLTHRTPEVRSMNDTHAQKYDTLHTERGAYEERVKKNTHSNTM